MFLSYRREYMANVSEADFQHFVSSPFFNPKLGWDNPTEAMKMKRTNSVGHLVEYNYANGYRVTPGVEDGHASVALFGESYAQGEEVPDDATIAAVLTRKYKLPTVNYGVNAYGPLQAVEKFEGLSEQQRSFHTAVLLIMHENVWRIVNSFKPVYSSFKSDFYFGLKPFVQDGRIVLLDYPTKYPDFLAEAQRRFESDYWTKPERSFPYSISLIKALQTHTFVSLMKNFFPGTFDYEYNHNPDTISALRVVLDEFVKSAEAVHIRPVIIFIPRHKESYLKSEKFVDSMNARWHQTLAYEFQDDQMDWNAYKLSKWRVKSHPSEYGYERLADFVHKVLQPTSPEAPTNRIEK